MLVVALKRYNRIPAILQRKEITAYRLASLVGMTEKAIYNLVNAKQIPPRTSYRTLRKIADALDVSIDALDGSREE